MKLTTKIIAMTASIVLLTGLIIGAVTIAYTNQSFGQYLAETQQIEVGQWEALYESYYYKNGRSWDGVQSLIYSYNSTINGYGSVYGNTYSQPIVLVSVDRVILADPFPELVGQRVNQKLIDHGFPMYDDKKNLIGYLIPLDYFNKQLWAMEERFIGNVQQSVVNGVLVTVLIAVIIAYAFARYTFMPLQRVIQSVRRIAQGATNEKVPVLQEDEIGELASSFNQMSEALSKSNDARVQLFADISHELRTPLTVIAGKLENKLNQTTCCTPEEISSLYDEVLRLNNMVSELQNISRLDAGHMTITKTLIDFKTFFCDFFLLFSADAEARNITLRIDIADEIPYCYADPERLKQIVINLVSNALRYTKDGGAIIFRAYSDEKNFIFDVTDTGIGMTEEECQHVFDRFYRTDRSRARVTGGTGLGMAITQGLVHAHGGSISVKSKKEVGTTFVVKLPLYQDETEKSKK